MKKRKSSDDKSSRVRWSNKAEVFVIPSKCSNFSRTTCSSLPSQCSSSSGCSSGCSSTGCSSSCRSQCSSSCRSPCSRQSSAIPYHPVFCDPKTPDQKNQPSNSGFEYVLIKKCPPEKEIYTPVYPFKIPPKCDRSPKLGFDKSDKPFSEKMWPEYVTDEMSLSFREHKESCCPVQYIENHIAHCSDREDREEFNLSIDIPSCSKPQCCSTPSLLQSQPCSSCYRAQTHVNNHSSDWYKCRAMMITPQEMMQRKIKKKCPCRLHR